jgi:cupin fold WbuC family metalloprotein
MDNNTHIRRESEEVLYDLDTTVRVGRQEVDFLKKGAGQNQRNRIRLCAHGSTDDSLHEMFIVHTKETYVRPHRHLGKSEALHVIEGTVDLVTFDDTGDITGVTSMGDYQSGRTFYHRLSEPAFHTLLITSDVVVFHEITNGPFDRADTIWAPWAPEDSDIESVNIYTEKLARSVAMAASK